MCVRLGDGAERDVTGVRVLNAAGDGQRLGQEFHGLYRLVQCDCLINGNCVGRIFTRKQSSYPRCPPAASPLQVKAKAQSAWTQMYGSMMLRAVVQAPSMSPAAACAPAMA